MPGPRIVQQTRGGTVDNVMEAPGAVQKPGSCQIGNPIPGGGRVLISSEYDAETDALTDGSGIDWERAG